MPLKESRNTSLDIQSSSCISLQMHVVVVIHGPCSQMGSSKWSTAYSYPSTFLRRLISIAVPIMPCIKGIQLIQIIRDTVRAAQASAMSDGTALKRKDTAPATRMVELLRVSAKTCWCYMSRND